MTFSDHTQLTFFGHELRTDAEGRLYVADWKLSDHQRARAKKVGLELSGGAWRIHKDRICLVDPPPEPGA